MLKRKILAILTAGVIASGMSINVLPTYADELTEVKQVKVDKWDLQDFVDYLQSESIYREKNWTRDSGGDYVNALNEAKNVLNNPNATQWEVDDANVKLALAANDLVGIGNERETSKLEDLIKKADEYFTDTNFVKFEEMEWDNFSDALNEAKDVFNNPHTTQIEIDNATDKLNNALQIIVTCHKVQLRWGTEVLKRKLDNSWDDMEGKRTCFTAYSEWGDYQTIFLFAEQTLNDPNATKSEIDYHLNRVNKAIDKLANY